MEIPYQGRAIISEYFDGAGIIIPVKKNWFLIVFTIVFQCLFLSFVIFACTLLTGTGAQGARVFMYLLITVWAVLNVFYTRRLWWNLAGREVIQVSPGTLTIERKGLLFNRAKSYDLSLCTNFRALEPEPPIYLYYNREAELLRKKPRPGTIRFDYDVVDTIQFGDWLSEAEGNYILERLRAKKLINSTLHPFNHANTLPGQGHYYRYL